jgi:hypothetical protein
LEEQIAAAGHDRQRADLVDEGRAEVFDELQGSPHCAVTLWNDVFSRVSAANV